jgi:hypothetical protein
MYSEPIIEQNVAHVEKLLGIKLVRFEIEETRQWVESLNQVWDPDTGSPTRELTADEREFTRNEKLMAKFDFRYWHDRYCFMSKDGAVGGGTGISELWVSQENLLSLLAEIEEQDTKAISEGYPVFGSRIADHKARQLGHTHISRALCMHRLTLWSSTRAMAASVDDDKIMELFDRDKLILDNLPWWLKPSMEKGKFFENKNEHMNWKTLNNRILYQQSNQQSGLGQGRQFEVAHLTECSSFPYPKMIEIDFAPTLPDAVTTLCILESTAQRRGDWWHDFTERVRRGKEIGWNYCFTPWYIEPKKYRARVPSGWIPSQHTEEHAETVERTSPEFCRGNTHRLRKEQLYWYETKRASAMEANSLNIFLTNYCATPEESFQFVTESAFPFEVIDRYRQRSFKGVPYELNLTTLPGGNREEFHQAQ